MKTNNNLKDKKIRELIEERDDLDCELTAETTYKRVAVCAAIFLFVLWTWNMIATSDNIDIDVLGKYLCEKEGYDFAESTLETDLNKPYINPSSLVIKCKEKIKETPIKNGYIVLIGD